MMKILKTYLLNPPQSFDKPAGRLPVKIYRIAISALCYPRASHLLAPTAAFSSDEAVGG